jgi:F-type H+-transporting ATPase subunit b
MHFDWVTLALQTVNFGILVWLLHRFLYKPVLRMIDARRAEIDKRFEDAGKAQAAARAGLDAVASERAAVAAERAAALKAAAAEAETAAAGRREKAEQEASTLLEEARKSLAAERAAAIAETRRAAIDLGVEIARRLIGDIPAHLRAEAWLERIERHLAGLPTGVRDAMLGSAGKAGVEVVTAGALPDASISVWLTRLQKVLDDRIEIGFAVDPALIAGVELHFPAAVLRLSWRQEIETLRHEIETHGDDR